MEPSGDRRKIRREVVRTEGAIGEAQNEEILEEKEKFEGKLRDIQSLGIRHRVLDDLLKHISNPGDHNMPRRELLWEMEEDIRAIGYPPEEYDLVLKRVGSDELVKRGGVGGSKYENELRRLAVTEVVRYVEATREEPDKTPPEKKVLDTAAPMIREKFIELEDKLNSLVVGAVDLKEPGKFIMVLTALVAGRSEYGKVYLLNELQDILERGGGWESV